MNFETEYLAPQRWQPRGGHFEQKHLRCQLWATIGTIAMTVSAAASIASMGYQASQGNPKMPNGASASREIAMAQAMSLPMQRYLAALEQQGGKVSGQAVTMTGQEANDLMRQLKQKYKASHKTDQMALAQMNILKQELLSQKQGKGVKGDGANIPKDVAGSTFTFYKDQNGNWLPKSIATADFTGLGTADVEGKLARQTMDIQTELGKKYGVQFATEAAREAALADPEGTKARQIEHDLIEQQINNPQPINPLSGTLDTQIDSQLKAGSGLDSMSRDLLDSAVARANADRSGNLGSGAAADSMSTGMEGAARRQAGINKAQSWLSSGSTPEDINYRREQQNLSNLGSFIGGRTPQSQFQNLSGAGQGATPFYPGQAGPQMPGGASSQGGPYSMAAWQAQLHANQGQANSWMAGLSGILNGIGAWNQAAGH